MDISDPRALFKRFSARSKTENTLNPLNNNYISNYTELTEI